MPSRKPASEAQLSYKPENYAYTVIWSEEDQAYIGRIAGFPLLAAHGASPEAALKEMTNVVRYALEDLEESGEEIPAPLSMRHFSGMLRLRPVSRGRTAACLTESVDQSQALPVDHHTASAIPPGRVRMSTFQLISWESLDAVAAPLDRVTHGPHP